ncbi:MAG: putative lipid II flippase FtsW [Actinobacteria bacterium]|nr:putative lipid II flippase FtsW [Actinomycetota bacterium]
MLLSLVGVLVLFGLVMVLSSSSVVSFEETGSTWSYFVRQGAWAVMGALGMGLFLVLERRVWRRICRIALLATLAALVAVLVPGVGASANGATRWIDLGPFQLQPSEFAKLTALLFVADLLAKRASEVHDMFRTFLPVVGVLIVLAVLVLAQPNLGTTIILAAIVLTMLWVAGARGGPLFLAAALGAAGAAYLMMTTPFRRARFFAFLNPWADPQNTGYQNVQSLIGLSDGGVGGRGLGASRAKWGFLPFAHTDFIFAIIGEELGFAGAVLVVLLFVTLAVVGVRIAMRAPDRYSALVATGVTTWFLVQAFVNIGVVVALLPVTGVPLPFVSYGGSSLLVTMTATGLLLNIARTPRAGAGLPAANVPAPVPARVPAPVPAGGAPRRAGSR